jgi:hypothetical protein
MKKGHYGQYTGNARHSRKEEMIHDRELIYDAKKQLHHADQDYKHDSPARMNADLKYDPVNDRANSPMFNLNKGYTPLRRVADVFDKNTNLTSNQNPGGSGGSDSSYTPPHPDAREIATGKTTTTTLTPKPSTDPTAKLGPGESTKEASRNLSRKRGKQARTEAKLARAEAGSKKAGRIKGKLAKTNSQIGHLESKIKNAKTPKGSGGSGGSGATRSSGSRVTNNIYVNSVAKMNGSPLDNVACKYTKRK